MGVGGWGYPGRALMGCHSGVVAVATGGLPGGGVGGRCVRGVLGCLLRSRGEGLRCNIICYRGPRLPETMRGT